MPASSHPHDDHNAQTSSSNVRVNDLVETDRLHEGSVKSFTLSSAQFSSMDQSDSSLASSRQKLFTTSVDPSIRTSSGQRKPSDEQLDFPDPYQTLDERLQSPRRTISHFTANPSPPLEYLASDFVRWAQDRANDQIKMERVSIEELKLPLTSESYLIPETTISGPATTEPKQASHIWEHGQAAQANPTESDGPGATIETSPPAQPDGKDQALLKSMNSEMYSPSSNAGITKLASCRRRASAPPTCPVGIRVPSHDRDDLTKLNFATMIPQSAPAYAQQIAHLQTWCALLPRLTDSKFQKLLATVVGNKMEKIWLEAMRTGMVPIDWQDDMRIQEQAGRTDVNFGDVEIMRQKITEAEIFSQGGRYLLTKDKSKKKRPLYPSQEIVIDTRLHGRPKNHAITAGELQEAGVSFGTIQRRVASRDLGDYDELVADILEDLDQEDITKVAWRAVVAKTAHNPLGRELKLYCLWEVEKALREVQFLENLKPTFRFATQVKNTETRIAAEQELHDQLLAIASELHAMEQPGFEGSGYHEGIVTENAKPNSIAQAAGVESLHTANQSKEIVDTDSEISNANIDETSSSQDTLYDRGQVQAQNGEVQPIVIIKMNSGLKREVDEVESSNSNSEPPPKRLPSLDGAPIDAPEEIPYTNIDVQLSHGEGDVFASVSSAFATLPPEAAAKQWAYIQYILQPQVNNMLLTRHRSSVPINATWSDMCAALRAADVPTSLYADLVRDLKDKIDAWDVPVNADNGDVEDIPGYPTRKEIWNAFPKEGLTGKELQTMFLGRVGSSDEKWRTLVRSVAHYDPANTRFYCREELQEHLRNRKIVRLRTRPDFNPEDWSCHILNACQEFRYRYVASSTPTQRESMHQAIANHVCHTKLIAKQPIHQGPGNPKKVDYYGRYDVLVHPQDVLNWRTGSGGEPAPIVHGIWDLRGLKRADNRVPGMQWFYKGHDGEVVGKWIVRHENDKDGNVTTIWERAREGMDAEDQIAGKYLGNVESKGKGKASKGKGLKLNVNALVAGTPGVSGKGVEARKRAAVHGGKGMGLTKGKKRKTSSPDPRSVATSQSKRAKTVGLSYAEDAGDDSDGEFMP